MSWAEIKKAINSNLSKTLDKLITEKATEIINSITSNNSLLNNSTYGLSALKTAVNTVNTNVTTGNIPVVKSVQRGISRGGGTIYISSVNVNKSIVLLNGDGLSDSMGMSLPTLDSITPGTITIRASNSVSWQVIEFY